LKHFIKQGKSFPSSAKVVFLGGSAALGMEEYFAVFLHLVSLVVNFENAFHQISSLEYISV